MHPVLARLQQWAIEALSLIVKSVVKSAVKSVVKLSEGMRFMHPYPLPFLARMEQWATEPLATRSGSYTTLLQLVCVCLCVCVSHTHTHTHARARTHNTHLVDRS